MTLEMLSPIGLQLLLMPDGESFDDLLYFLIVHAVSLGMIDYIHEFLTIWYTFSKLKDHYRDILNINV